jgi:soluble lytic murein transglycosylase
MTVRFEFLCANPYVWPVRIRLFPAIFIVAVLLSRTGNLSAASLTEDSVRFAACWLRLQAGDTTAAEAFLKALSDSSDTSISRTANFYSAWLALARGRKAEVSSSLARGVPPELADYALRLEASALVSANREESADSLWTALAFDTCTIHAAEACRQLGRRASDARNLDLLQRLIERCEQIGSDPELKQELARGAATAETRLQKHEMAVDRLWSAYLLDPSTAAAAEIRDDLRQYTRRYGYAPRELTAAELERELLQLAESGSNKTGLSRVTQELQRASGPQNADLLSHFKGRFEAGLRRYREAVATLRDHVKRFPQSRWRSRSLYQLGRSAYLTDQDSLALSALNELASDSTNRELQESALDLIGILHRDRSRPAEAVQAYLRWDSLADGSSPDCLWRLGWSQWEAKGKNDAAKTWLRLASRDEKSDWTPTSLYWAARAFGESNSRLQADSLSTELHRRFPYSYYSVIAPSSFADSSCVGRPLIVPTLDEIVSSGGLHARKFALLAAMRLSEWALPEWSAAQAELSPSDGFWWWKARLHVWNGNRDAAWLVILTRLSYYIRTIGERPDEFYTLVYPQAYQENITKLSNDNSLDPYFVMALVCQESHFNKNAVSPVGAVGLTQLMPSTAKREARKLDAHYSASKLRDPEFNLRLGISHLAGLFKDFSNDSVLVLAAYNAGPSAAQAWFEEFGDCPKDVFIERIPYRETRLFIKRNIEHRAAYRRLYPKLSASPTATPSTTP